MRSSHRVHRSLVFRPFRFLEEFSRILIEVIRLDAFNFPKHLMEVLRQKIVGHPWNSLPLNRIDISQFCGQQPMDMTNAKIIEIAPTTQHAESETSMDAFVQVKTELDGCSSTMGSESVKEKLRKVLETGRQSDATCQNSSGSPGHQEMYQNTSAAVNQVHHVYPVQSKTVL